MKGICGILGSWIFAMLTFRLVYGAWPPFEGNLGEWLSSDSRARWALLAGFVFGVIGAVVGRAIGGVLNKDK
jgi:uncharacterized membrane protein YeaQ/YmgE (transglycosylase-associated protein family)